MRDNLSGSNRLSRSDIRGRRLLRIGVFQTEAWSRLSITVFHGVTGCRTNTK